MNLLISIKQLVKKHYCLILTVFIPLVLVLFAFIIDITLWNNIASSPSRNSLEPYNLAQAQAQVQTRIHPQTKAKIQPQALTQTKTQTQTYAQNFLESSNSAVGTNFPRNKAQYKVQSSNNHDYYNNYNRYELIFFYSTRCKFCTTFGKTLRTYTDYHHIPVTAFKLSSESSIYFPNSVLVDQDTIATYFGKEANIAVPVLFILNPINMHVYQVSRGNLTYAELTARMNTLMQRILDFEARENKK